MAETASRGGKEAQNLAHHAISLVGWEQELRVRGAIENDEFLRVGGFLVLCANPGEPRSGTVRIVARNNE